VFTSCSPPGHAIPPSWTCLAAFPQYENSVHFFRAWTFVNTKAGSGVLVSDGNRPCGVATEDSKLLQRKEIFGLKIQIFRRMSTDSTEILNRSGTNQSLGWRLKTFCGKSESYAEDSRLPLKIEMFNTTSNCSAEDRKGLAEKNKKPRRTPRLPQNNRDILLKIQMFRRRWNGPADISKLLRHFWIFRRKFRSSAGRSKTSAQNLKIWRKSCNSSGIFETSANFHDFSWQFKTSAEVLNFQRKFLFSSGWFHISAEVFIFQRKIFISSGTFYFPADVLNFQRKFRSPAEDFYFQRNSLFSGQTFKFPAELFNFRLKIFIFSWSS